MAYTQGRWAYNRGAGRGKAYKQQFKVLYKNLTRWFTKKVYGEKKLLITPGNKDSSIESNVQAKEPVIQILAVLPFSQKQENPQCGCQAQVH